MTLSVHFMIPIDLSVTSVEIAIKQNVSCKVEPLDPKALNPIEDLMDYDPVEGVIMFGPMAIWKYVVRRMNSEKPVSLALHFFAWLIPVCAAGTIARSARNPSWSQRLVLRVRGYRDRQRN